MDLTISGLFGAPKPLKNALDSPRNLRDVWDTADSTLSSMFIEDSFSFCGLHSKRAFQRDVPVIFKAFLGEYVHISYLVGGSEHSSFFHILEIIIPTDFHIFQRS